MTEKKQKEVCKKCRWRELRWNKKTKKPENWCIEAGWWINELVKCPL